MLYSCSNRDPCCVRLDASQRTKISRIAIVSNTLYRYTPCVSVAVFASMVLCCVCYMCSRCLLNVNSDVTQFFAVLVIATIA